MLHKNAIIAEKPCLNLSEIFPPPPDEITLIGIVSKL
jgi:hypothetical protein